LVPPPPPTGPDYAPPPPNLGGGAAGVQGPPFPPPGGSGGGASPLFCVGGAGRPAGFGPQRSGCGRRHQPWKPRGQAAMGQDQDDTVILPLRTVQRRLTGRQDINSITLSVRDGASTAKAKSQVEAVLRERRKIGPGEEDNFSVMDTKQIAETLAGTTKVMTMLLGAVAAVSLLVGGIGIMNIMLVSVTERTKEIGVRLAIGALEQDVLLQFLVESVVLAAFGGLAGVLIAAVASVTLAQVIQVPFLFDPGINLLAFVVAVIIGVVFGYFPARRAARLDPIEALRRE